MESPRPDALAPVGKLGRAVARAPYEWEDARHDATVIFALEAAGDLVPEEFRPGASELTWAAEVLQEATSRGEAVWSLRCGPAGA